MACRGCHTTAFILALVSTSALLFSYVTPFLRQSDHIRSGLWGECNITKATWNCTWHKTADNLLDTSGMYIATVVLNGVAILLGLIGLPVGCCGLCAGSLCLRSAGAIYVITGMSSIAGLVMYVLLITSSDVDCVWYTCLYIGTYIGLAGGCLAVGAGVTFMVAWRWVYDYERVTLSKEADGFVYYHT